MKRLILAAALSVSLLPALTRADESAGTNAAPATRPSRSDRPMERSTDRRDGPRWRDRMGTGTPGSGGPVEQLSQQDKEEIENFMKTYSPKRWEKFQDVPDERKEKILRLIRGQYRNLERMKQDDPSVYKLRIARLPIEDEMFNLAWQINHGDTKNSAELRKTLHDKVRQFVENSLEERKVHIERMQDRLRKQQQELETAQAELKKYATDKDSLIDKGVEDIASERGGALKDLAGPSFLRRPRDVANPAATEPSADGGDAPQ